MAKQPPQYAKSADPEVVAAITRNREMRRELHKAGLALAAKYGSDSYSASGFAGRLSIAGVKHKPEGHGQWKRTRGGYWAPYKRNPIAREFAALTRQEEAVPGLPEVVYGRYNRDGTQTLYTPMPFVYGDVAWVGFHEAPQAKDSGGIFGRDEWGDQWVEVLASEFFAAREALAGQAAAA
jgi:hypothetical protein